MADVQLQHVIKIARLIHESRPAHEIWQALDDAVSVIFPYQLFTVSVFDQDTQTTCRVYTTRNDVQPIGARKKVTASQWTRQVLENGNKLYGPTIEDLKMFSEWEFLASIGCACVLNTPIKDSSTGQIVGILNILGTSNAYDKAPTELAVVLGQLVAGILQASREETLSLPFDGKMETV